jgi:hypothetical protein
MMQPAGKSDQLEHRCAHQFTQLAGVIPQGPKTDTATDPQNHILAVGFMFNQMGAKAGAKNTETKQQKQSSVGVSIWMTKRHSSQGTKKN